MRDLDLPPVYPLLIHNRIKVSCSTSSVSASERVSFIRKGRSLPR